MYEQFKNIDYIITPRVWEKYCNEKCITMDYIEGESITEYEDIKLYSHGKYSRQFIEEHYSDLTLNSIYKNRVDSKEVIWKGHIKDLKYMQVNNYLGWILSFDNEYEVSNHLPISHWGLRHGAG